MGSAVPTYLSKRQWLQQTLPGVIEDFGPTPSRRGGVHSPFQVAAWDVSGTVDDFVGKFDDSSPDQAPFDTEYLAYNEPSKATASTNFWVVLRKVGRLLGYNLLVQPNAQSRSSPRPNVDASQRAVMLASSSVQKADYGVSVDGRQFLVVEMKRPAVFRRSANSAIPNLCSALLEDSRRPSSTATAVSVEPVFQLYSVEGMMVKPSSFLKAYPAPVPGS
ncbi:hypothetical protein M758_1G147100 [Ceratodon purpureus]|uniref:Uncharacterized protein n=1 Tax=Ceratodon purpureus TaxID=3225 RepID=A0A8T0J8D8_CERPU|nr:hypothetical protein KC19_1G150300 [Ceratodon purpureus]KAG0630009.1 hypothetical protein M758_1G147100 [Ceratodon purpureus]